MKTLRRWLRYRARIRYWKSRAEASEQRVLDLQASLDAERWRNMEREDTMVSASVMGQRGMWGVPPRLGPAYQTQQVSHIPPQPQTWDSHLSGIEKMEWQTIFLPDALQNGVSIQKAQQDFARIVSQRRQPMNDEGFH